MRGTVGQRAHDGLWFAAIDLERSPEGKRRRKVKYAKSRQEARALLESMQDLARPRPDPSVRFWGYVTKLDCWEWTGVRVHGYGQFWTGERRVPAHRWAYEQVVGTIPDGLTIDHLCRNKRCVNPDHLEPVTQAENTRRAVAYEVAERRARAEARRHARSVSVR